MPRYKKSKKSFQPSQTSAFLIPINIAAGPLGIGVDLNPVVGPKGAFRPWTDSTHLTTPPGSNNGSEPEIVVPDAIVNQQPNPSGVSTATPGSGDTITRESILLRLIRPMPTILTPIHDTEHEREVPLDAPNERSALIASDLSSVIGRRQRAQNEGVSEHQGTPAERRMEAPAERSSRGVHTSKNAQEMSRKDRAIGVAGIVFDTAMGAAEAFSPLKAALATISAVYAQYKARPPGSF
jgi:hypothetical protein